MTMTAPSDNPFAAHLNPSQAEAVLHHAGPLLVFAGAGSGKTRVITFRIANLIATHGVPPYRILAVTFTNKAAGEMKERLDKLLGHEIARDIWVGTFHATCARLLRRHAEAVGLRREFVIYDDGDQRALLARVLKALEIDDRMMPVKTTLPRIMKEKQEGRTPQTHGLDASFGRVFEAYQDALARANAVDFEDLIGNVMRLVESPLLPAGNELRQMFDHVLVDEFQDTNRVQYRLVRGMVTAHHNLCVVGDDDQSIYRWRGGDVRIIRGFKRDFPEAKIVKLEENYRSTARIVRAALGVIAPSDEREPKELFTRNPDGHKISLLLTRDERDEAASVVAGVKQALEAGTPASQIAVFYRIHAMSRVLEDALRAEKVPYRIVGGVRFFERAEVKDILSYLRVVQNPRSDVDLLRIINVPTRGIGDGSIIKLSDVARAHDTSLYDAIMPAITEQVFTGAARTKVSGFRDLIEHLRGLQATLGPAALTERVLVMSGYQQALKAEDTAEADARLENIGELVGSMKEYEDEQKAAGEKPTLSGYLERVTLSSSADEQGKGEMVSLMTVHSSKGLEFDHVFIIGLETDVFPYVRTNEDGLRQSDEEEERRLAYVALTRARKRLYLTYTLSRTIFGNTRRAAPSPFLASIPRDDIAQTVTQAARDERELGPSRPQASSGRGSYHGPSAWAGRNTGSWSSRPGQRPQPQRPQPQRSPPRDEYAQAPAGEHSQVAPDESAVHLRKGQRVRHPRFGIGTVVGIETEGERVSAIVTFPAWGQKKVLLSFLEMV